MIAGDPDLARTIREAIDGRRCVFVAGLPGAGKSLVVRLAAAAASDAGRTVHLLQWDVARLAFDTTEILARYPEVDGVTHAAIRVAVGRWARGAVDRWDRAHPGARHVLIGETPLVGERLMALARPASDAVEPLLAGHETLFLIPVPAREVRRAIESARALEIAAPSHARDAASAPPHLVRRHWEEIEDVARRVGVPVTTPGEYDPEMYAETYRRLLRHRRCAVVRLERIVDVGESVHAAPLGAVELVPSPRDVADGIAEQMARRDDEVEGEAAGWYRAALNAG